MIAAESKKLVFKALSQCAHRAAFVIFLQKN